VRAINAFLHDIYHRQEILRAGRIPVDLIARNEAFLPQMIGVAPPGNVYTHIVGIDLVRTGEDEFFVLEDNARTPSGVSYMLENRETMLQMFPELFTRIKVQPVRTTRSTCAARSPPRARRLLARLHRGGADAGHPQLRLLRTRLPRRPDGRGTGRGHDLRIVDGKVAMRTTEGLRPIDVLYRRVDDDFLDPMNFNPDSSWACRGSWMSTARAASPSPTRPAPASPTTRRSTATCPISWSSTPARRRSCRTCRPGAVRRRMPWPTCSITSTELVVKEVHGSGGYGMLVGPAASKKEIAAFRKKLQARPGNYIAQPTLALSTVPILTKAGLAPRHVDLRPFVQVRPDGCTITPGGLTRVALKKGRWW
jgi:uncharacterized circularly permuted ATP-grasp superfamily protein